jgi:hypothetical protein
MPTDIPYAILQFLVDHPELIYVYIGAMVVATALRAAWDVTEERPRWVRAVLAVADLLQLNISGPAKLIANKAKAAKAEPPAGPQP